jgi:hypothetical protein
MEPKEDINSVVRKKVTVCPSHCSCQSAVHAAGQLCLMMNASSITVQIVDTFSCGAAKAAVNSQDLISASVAVLRVHRNGATCS